MINRLLLIVFLMAACMSSYSQGGFRNTASQYNDSTLATFKGGTKSSMGFINAVYVDTTAANLTPIDFYPGAQIFTSGDNGYWYRDKLAKKWIRVSASITSFTFNTDSTLIICFDNGICDTITVSGGGGGGSTTINNIYDNSIVIIGIYNDSCLYRCTGLGVCDTVCTNFTITSWEVLSCSTVAVVGYLYPDSITVLYDTLDFGECIPLYIFQNWLSQPSVGIHEFGARSPGASGWSLGHNTYTTTSYFQMFWYGHTVYDAPHNFISQQSFQNGTPVISLLHSGGNALVTGQGNAVKMYLNYTDSMYAYAPTPLAGYFGNAVGYSFGNNWQGHGSFGNYLDDMRSKTTGIFYHTKDSSNVDGVTIYAAPILGGTFPNMNGSLPNYRTASFGTDGSVKFDRITTSAAKPRVAMFDANGKLYSVDTTGLFGSGGGGGSNTDSLFGLQDNFMTAHRNVNANRYKFEMEKLNFLQFEVGASNDTYLALDSTYYSLAVYTPGMGNIYHDVTNNPTELFHQIGAANKVDLYMGYHMFRSGGYYNLDVRNYGHYQQFNIDSSGLWINMDGDRIRIDTLNSASNMTGKKVVVWSPANGKVEVIAKDSIGAIYTGSELITLVGNDFQFGGTATTDRTATLGANTVLFTANSLAGDAALSISSNATTAASNLQKGLNIEMLGANATSTQTTFGLDVNNTHTGTTSSNVAARFQASGATNNYALIVPASSGRVGIGTSTPSFMVHVDRSATISNTLDANIMDISSSVVTLDGTSITGNKAVVAKWASLNLALNANQTINNSTDVAAIFNGTVITSNTPATLTMSQGSSTVRAVSATKSFIAMNTFNSSSVISHVANFHVESIQAPGVSGTISNYYGLLIESQTANATSLTLTNRWGIYQEGASDRNYFAAKVGIGTATPVASALLDMTSTTSGLLIPRMTSAQRTAISSPATGLQVYDTDSLKIGWYDGSAWRFPGYSTGGGATYTASNGLTMTANDTKLGGTLSQNTTVAVSTFNMTFSGAASGGDVLSGITSSTGVGVSGQAIGAAGTGVAGSSIGGSGVTGSSGTGLAGSFLISPASLSTVGEVIRVRNNPFSGTSNGIGGSINYYSMTSTNTFERLSTQLISKFTDATDATRTSQFIITGVNSAVTQNLLSLAGSGQMTLDQYTGTNFNTAQAKVAMVGTDGKVYAVDTTGLFSGGGSASITADNGLTENVANNIQLGGTLLQTTTVTGGGFAMNFDNNTGTGTLTVTNSSNGYALQAIANSSIGLWAESTTGTAIYSQGGDNVELFEGLGTQSNTTTVRPLSNWTLNSSGTADAGFGQSHRYLLETSTTGSVLAGRDVISWSVATHASRTSWRDFYGIDNASEERFMNIQPTLVRINNDADTLAPMSWVRANFSSGGAAPGSNTEVIFNDGGVLDGDPNFVWNKTNQSLYIYGGTTNTGALTVSKDLDANTYSLMTLTNAGSDGGGIDFGDAASSGFLPFITTTSGATYNWNIWRFRTQDAGSNPVLEFDVSNQNGTAAITGSKPIFKWSNFLTGKMQMQPDGSLLLGTATPIASSLLTLASTTQGLLIPRMNTTQMNAISSPATGLIITNTDSVGVNAPFHVYDGTAWRGVRYKYQDVAGGGGLSDTDYGDITVSGGGTVMTFDYKRNMVYTTATGTDANITAVPGTAYNLPAATLSTGRTIDVSGLNANGDYVEFYNNEEGFVWSFTGATVYDSDGTTAITELLINANSVIRRVNGKLMISKL